MTQLRKPPEDVVLDRDSYAFQDPARNSLLRSPNKSLAHARLKMDKQDAKTLAYLLKGDLVAESYVPTGAQHA
jgi:hypothetical protein